MRWFFQTTHQTIKVIVPTASLLEKMMRCLDLIPKRYRVKCTILVTPNYRGTLDCTPFGRNVIAFEAGRVVKGDDHTIASDIVHEMTHVYQGRHGNKGPTKRSELAALNRQLRFLKQIDRMDLYKWYAQFKKARWWDNGSSDFVGQASTPEKWALKYWAGKLRIRVIK